MDRKPLFDAVRQLLGKPFTQAEVDKLDRAIDTANAYPEPVEAPCQPSARSGGRTLGKAGADLIKSFEGCARPRADGCFEAYPDPGTHADPWTIGWGSTGPDIEPGVIWTQAQCDERFDRDMQRYADEVSQTIGDAPTTQNQFDALVSFHYNTGAIASATLTRKHKAGDYAGAAAEFARWNRAGGQVMAGLTHRRAAEAQLYMAP